MRWIMVLMVLGGCTDETYDECTPQHYEVDVTLDPHERDPYLLTATAKCQQQADCYNLCNQLMYNAIHRLSFAVTSCVALDDPPTMFHIIGSQHCVY